jgi:broad specificity phosphatase PhoE
MRKLILLLHIYQKKRRPKRIILVRHGNSMANNNYAILQTIPDNKVHLSEKGIQQAKEAGKRLKKILGNESIQFYVSPYTRTKETYENILESLKSNYSSVVYLTSLREQEYGNLQSEMERQFKEQKEMGVSFTDSKTVKAEQTFMQECPYFCNIFSEGFFLLIITHGIILL